MSLVVFTALVGLVVAPGHVHPVIGVDGAAVHRRRRRRRRRAQHVVRRRYRRADGAHRQPADPARPRHAAARRWLRHDACGFSVVALGLLVNWLAARAAGLHHLLLCRALHDVAQALDAAEHRHRRRRRRAAADDRLGGGDRRSRHRAARAVSDHLLLDAAAFLGAVAVSHRRLCARRHSDAAGGRRRTGNAAPDPALYADRWRRSACAWLLGYAGLALRHRGDRDWRHHGRRLRCRVRAEQRGHMASKQLFAFSILYLFLLFAMLLVDRMSGGLFSLFAA